jgi:hypothetical protein
VQKIARAVAILAIAVSAVIATAYAVQALREPTAWAIILVFVAACACLTLAVGTGLWRGREARFIRSVGVALALAAALGTVSFAWILVPVVLPSILSLRLVR